VKEPGPKRDGAHPVVGRRYTGRLAAVKRRDLHDRDVADGSEGGWSDAEAARPRPAPQLPDSSSADPIPGDVPTRPGQRR
jgi:hypothetical protein